MEILPNYTYCQSVASNGVAHNHATSIAINDSARQPFDFIRKWAFFFFIENKNRKNSLLKSK